MGVLSSPIGGLRVHTKITPLVFTLTSISRLSLVRFQPFFIREIGLSWTWTAEGRRRTKGEDRKVRRREKTKVNGERIMLPSK